MNTTEIIVCLLAISLVTLDVIVRLRTNRHRKDQYLEELFDSLLEPEHCLPPSASNQPGLSALESLVENLLCHFEQSAISRNVLHILALQNRPMAATDILAAVNHHLAVRRRPELPARVVRRVVMTLLGANLVALHQGGLQITRAGRQLNGLLDARTVGVPSPPVFVSH